MEWEILLPVFFCAGRCGECCKIEQKTFDGAKQGTLLIDLLYGRTEMVTQSKENHYFNHQSVIYLNRKSKEILPTLVLELI